MLWGGTSGAHRCSASDRCLGTTRAKRRQQFLDRVAECAAQLLRSAVEIPNPETQTRSTHIVSPRASLAATVCNAISVEVEEECFHSRQLQRDPESPQRTMRLPRRGG